MNTFATNTNAVRTVAQQTIADRIHDAERRSTLRAVRAERRAVRRAERAAARAAYDESVRHLPGWAFRFVHPVH